MKGHVFLKEDRLWVEYIALGSELDEVQKEQMMIVFTDQHKTSPGETVDFVVLDTYTISGEPLAKIK